MDPLLPIELIHLVFSGHAASFQFSPTAIDNWLISAGFRSVSLQKERLIAGYYIAWHIRWFWIILEGNADIIWTNNTTDSMDSSEKKVKFRTVWFWASIRT